MSKRRTRKEKRTAKHNFVYSWSETKETNRGSVKGQTKSLTPSLKKEIQKKELAYSSDKDKEFEFIKRDVVKSLITASLILALEVVLYLI